MWPSRTFFTQVTVLILCTFLQIFEQEEQQDKIDDDNGEEDVEEKGFIDSFLDLLYILL